jgi:hypothetical protein
MAERCPVFNMGITVPTMATPALTLSPDLDLLHNLDMSNEEEFFFMDGSELVLEEDNIDTFTPLATEVDQAQVRLRDRYSLTTSDLYDRHADACVRN